MKTKRLIIFGFLAALIGSLTATLVSPGIASAIGTGQWVDQSKIILDGKEYIDTNVADDRHQFHLDGNDDERACVDVIKEFKDGAGNGTEPSKAARANLVKWRDPFGSVSNVPGGSGQVCFVRSSESFNIDQSTVSKASIAPTGQAKEPNSCESSGGMAWILCPMIKSLDAAMDWLDGQIQALLEVDESAYNNPELYRAWSQIRNIAYIILIPIMLVMVLGTAMGIELFSAYTVKKALPRMVAAILFITLSYQICTFLIGLANVVGTGTLGLLSSPFNHLVGGGKSVGTAGLSDLFGPGNGVLSGILLLPKVVAAAVGVIIILWLFGVTILLFVGTAFLVLLLRQIFIIALLLLAPLAILAWIFPGNDKLWKTWWGAFSKLLIMFPLIMALIAVGRDMAWLINTPDRAGGLQGTFITPVAKLALYMLPYAFIPFTFKFAGGLFATISGMANDKSKGLFDRQKKKRAEKLENAKNQRVFKNAPRGGLRDRINRTGGYVGQAGKAGFNPRNWRANLRSAVDDADALARKKGVEDPELAGNQNYDDIMRAGAVAGDRQGVRAELQRQDQERYTNARQAALDGGATAADAEAAGLDAMRYRNPRNLENDVARVERYRSKMGDRAFRQMAALQTVAGGTASADPTEALAILAQAAGGDDAVLMNLVADYRKAAMGAGRVDQGGASQGVTFNAARDIMRAMEAGPLTQAQTEDFNNRIYDGVLAAQGANVLSHPSMKAQAVDNLIPSINARLDAALATGDTDQIDLALADVANMQDTLAASSPQLANRFSERVLRRQIDVGSLSQPARDSMDSVITERSARQEVHVRDQGTGNMRVEYVGGDPVSSRRSISALEALNARRGSTVLQSKRREYATEQAARAGGPPQPGGPGTPPVQPIGGGPQTGI